MMYNNMNIGPVYQWATGFGSAGVPVSGVGSSIAALVFALVILAVLAIKGYALWHAAKRDEKWWFIALLVINTLGLLELYYLIIHTRILFSGKKGTE